MTRRTSSWCPRSGSEVPGDEVAVTPGDVVHFFLSAILDHTEPPKKGQEMPTTGAKMLMDTLAYVFVDMDFDEVRRKILSPYKEFDGWLWEGYETKKKERSPEA